jgi:hypothetical protein
LRLYVCLHWEVGSADKCRAATAVGSLQLFCSLGFSFTESLSLGKLMSGDFGCDSVGCYASLLGFFVFGAGGVVSQLKGLKIEVAMAAGDWEPSNAFEKYTGMIQQKMQIVFHLNSTLLEAAKTHTPEELAEMAKENAVLMAQLMEGQSRSPQTESVVLSLLI